MPGDQEFDLALGGGQQGALLVEALQAALFFEPYRVKYVQVVAVKFEGFFKVVKRLV